MSRPTIPLFLIGLTALGCVRGTAQEGAPTGAPQDAKPAARPDVPEAFAKLGIELDLQGKKLALKVRVGRPADLLEYVLIARQGKSHEALLVAEVQPSILNAAMLLLGLTAGKNVEFKDKDPMPSKAEIEAGEDWFIIIPPKGPQVWFTLAWTDSEGTQHEKALDDLVLDCTTGEALEGADWIYLGGRMAPPYKGEEAVFIADLQGNLVSCCYLDPANHLVTLRHPHARSDMNWWMTEACPPPGTEAKLTVHTIKPKLVQEREERIAKERAAGKKPRGPLDRLPANPASGESVPIPPEQTPPPKGEKKEGEKKGKGENGGER